MKLTSLWLIWRQSLGTLAIAGLLGAAIILFGLGHRSASAQIPIVPGPIGGGSPCSATTNNGVLTLYLPTKELLTPDKLEIGNPGNVGTVTFTFNPSTGQFSPTSAGPYTVCTTTHYDSSGLDTGGRSLGYKIDVVGFVKGGGQLALERQKGGTLLSTVESKLRSSFSAKAFAPPFPCFAVCSKIVFPYRLTFKSGSGSSNLPKTAVTSYANYLIAHNNNLSDTYLCNNDGTTNNNGTNLCLKERATFTTVERGATGPIYTLQAIPLGATGSINVQGNAAAAGTIDGFSFNALSNAVAIGGSIPDGVPNASKTLQNYISQNATAFSWQNVEPQLNAIFAQRSKGTIPDLSGGSLFTGSVWHLNSNSTDPSNSTKNSFSTPPEGKLWQTASNSFLRFPADVTFDGSGTIAVNGPIEFDGNILCTPGTRLGIIAAGGISFSGSTINCGAYTALSRSSDISFNFQVTSGAPTARGIFVAGHSVKLPSLGLGASYNINYDDTFGAKPTVLYQELLSVVFSTRN